jgi:PAS domain S-box-containing protein
LLSDKLAGMAEPMSSASDAFRRSEKELRDAMELIPAMVFIVYPGASNAFANRSWREFTGLSLQDTSGLGWQTAIHSEDLERHLKKWEVSSAEGEPFEDEARFRRASDGEYRWFLVRAVPLHDDLGNISSAVADQAQVARISNNHFVAPLGQ